MAALLGACGDGQEPSAAPSARVHALAAPAPAITPSQLFDWVELTYPALFPKGPADQTLTSAGVTYLLRHYPGTGNYVGVGLADGNVYALGSFTGNQIRSYGKLVDYTCQVATTPCTVPLGKFRYAPVVDGEAREYYVHVPLGYTGLTALSVVFMLHGSGADGDKVYGDSGWVEAGEAHDVITVYPSSWTYRCVLDDGVNKRGASKWNAWGLTLCDATDHVRDDLKFLGQVIDEVALNYKVDTHRVYMVGFSSGGEMASRAAVDLGDRLAAVVSGAGGMDMAHVPKRLALPVTFQFGNEDNKVLARLGRTDPLPMDIALNFATYPEMQAMIDPFLSTFAMNPAYAVTGTPDTFLIASYSGQSGAASNVFRMSIIKGMGHQYPNGLNHPLKGAEVHWAWMKDFVLP